MKTNYLYIISFLLWTSLLLGSCTKTRLLGNWRVKSEGILKGSEFTFQKNGTLEIESTNQEIHLENWEYSPKKNLLTLSNTYQSTPQYYHIKHLNTIFLVLNQDSSSHTLIRQLKVKSFNYQKAKKRLRGGWSLVRLGKKNKGESSELQIFFWDNGAYQQIINGAIQLGQWQLDDKAQKIVLSSSDSEQNYRIKFLKNNKIELATSYDSYLFEQTDKIKKTPSNKKIERQIVGAWTIKKIGKQTIDIDYTMYLNPDGVLKIFEKQAASQIGRWFVTEDGSFLILQYDDTQEMYPIEKIQYRRLEIRDEFETVIFKKKNKLKIDLP